MIPLFNQSSTSFILCQCRLFLRFVIQHILGLSRLNSRQLRIHLVTVSSTLVGSPAPTGFDQLIISEGAQEGKILVFNKSRVSFPGLLHFASSQGAGLHKVGVKLRLHLFLHGLFSFSSNLFGGEFIFAAVKIDLDLTILAFLHYDRLGSLVECMVPPLKLKLLSLVMS